MPRSDVELRLRLLLSDIASLLLFNFDSHGLPFSVCFRNLRKMFCEENRTHDTCPCGQLPSLYGIVDGCKSLYAKFVFRHEAAHFKEVGTSSFALAVDNDMITSRHKGINSIARGGFHKCQEIERIFIHHADLVLSALPHSANAFTNLPEYLAVESHETVRSFTHRHCQTRSRLPPLT